MKSWLIVLLLALSGISLGVVAAYSYEIKTKNNQLQAAEVRAQQESREATYQADVKNLTAACLKGQEAYNALTPQQKQKLQSFTCSSSSN